MTWILPALILLPVVAYFAFLILMIREWKSLPVDAGGPAEAPFFSVIIPVRNEEEGLTKLINDLERQEYPSSRFEVIVVDDHSTDRTVDMLMERQGRLKFALHVCRLPREGIADGSPKKAAITLGIERARGEYIITTDGDCRAGTRWLDAFARAYQSRPAQLIAGPVMLLDDHSFFGRMQCIEFASLIGTGGALLSRGWPVMCNGANLSYRRSAFEGTGGYLQNRHIASGDDLFLLESIHENSPDKVYFLTDPESLILTNPAEGFRTFMQQRIRWAGKWNRSFTGYNRWLAIFIFLVHLCFIALVTGSIAGAIQPLIPVIALILKILLEYVFIRNIFRTFERRWHPVPFLISALFYSVYAIIFGILANMSQYSWKERKFNT